MTRYKLSLRTKIVATIIGVTLIVVVGGAWKAAEQVRAAERTGLLERPLKRYVDTLAQVGSGEYAVSRLIASDPGIVAALATADALAVQEACKRVGDVLQSAMLPDLFLISDMSGKVTGISGIKAPGDSEWKSSRLFQDLREGRQIRARFAEVAGQGYRISAVQVKSAERPVGIVLFGASLDRWFSDVIAKTSSAEKGKEQRLALVVGDRQIVASSAPRGGWAALSEAIQRPVSAEEDGRRFDVLEIMDRDSGERRQYDFAKTPVHGYSAGTDPDSIPFGSLYLFRDHERASAKVVDDRFVGLMLVLGSALVLSIAMGFILAFQMVETTLADLKTLISVIDDTASAVQEQAIASDEIARNMDAVQRIAGSVVNSSESAVTEGERLQALAEALEQSVRGFKIDPERVALDEAELKALPEHRA